jgi:Flp pilus assembly protein TadD
MATQTSVDKMFSALLSQQDLRSNVASSAVSSGLNLMQNKNFKAAEAAFRKATALKPDYVDAYNMLADAYLKQGKSKEAAQAYTISLKLDRNQEQVHINLASIYIDQKKFDDAQKELKAASYISPSDPLPQYTLGHLLLQMEKPVEAETAFRKAVRLAPKDGNAYYGLGLALNKEGKTDDAIMQLKRAMELKRDFAPAIAELGKSYSVLGDTDKVQQQIDQLNALQTSQADDFVADLSELIRKPRMTGINSDQSTFSTAYGATSLLALDAELFIQPGSVKELSLTFQFDSEMDTSSVTNTGNWKIGRSGGGTGGLYDNGTYSPTDRSNLTFMPNRVTYNPVSKEATVYFPLYQNDDATGTIDTSHLTFKFQGKDASGKSMDPTADQYNGFAGVTF